MRSRAILNHYPMHRPGAFQNWVFGTNRALPRIRSEAQKISKNRVNYPRPTFPNVERDSSTISLAKNFLPVPAIFASRLVPFLEPSLLDHLIVTGRFLTFITILLQQPEGATVIVDGACLRLNDWRAERANAFRALMRRNPSVQFILISMADLKPFAFVETNLVIVDDQLTPSNLNRLISSILGDLRGGHEI